LTKTQEINKIHRQKKSSKQDYFQRILTLHPKSSKATQRKGEPLLHRSRIGFSAITRMGRWDSGMPRREKLDVVKQFENILRGHNVPEDKIDDALQDWHRFNTRDLAAPIVDDMRTHISERIKRVRAEMTSSEEPSELTRLIKISGEIKNIYGMDTPEKIMDMFEKTLGDDTCFPGDEREIFINAHKEEIEDLRYYFKNENFRRLDHWLALDEKDK